MRHNKKILVKSNVKNVFLKNGRNEQVTYLQVPLDYHSYSLTEDIEYGAVHFREIREIMQKSGHSRIIAITADSLEMGLMGVNYLAMHLQGIREKDREIPFDFDLEEVGCSWYESEYKIPILHLSEISRYIRKDQQPFEHNGYLVAQARVKDDHVPYWRRCMTESICLVVNRSCVEEEDMNIIQLFPKNRQVYVIFLENPEKEGGMELPFGVMEKSQFLALRNNFILSYAADEATISFGENRSELYYKNVLKQNLKQRGIKVKKGFSYERVIHLAGTIDKKNLCEMIDKIVNYAIKDVSDSTNLILGNGDFKFIDHFSEDKRKGRGEKSGSQLLEENLVGMQEIKRQVRDVVNVMKYHQIRKNMNITGSHYHNVHVMLGAPGTAKTTVARYMGQMMFDEKLLSDSRFICINGAELKGMYVGHSAPKTRALFEKYDVIIIDEAYSIVESGGVTDSFGNEAIAQLIIELEKHSTDKLIIFAGYGGEDVEAQDNRMKDFLEANPGIKSRITSTFYFPSYTPEEMADIFVRIAEMGNYKVEPGAEILVRNHFAARVGDHDFGNGREARALLENTTLFAARRLMSTGKSQFTDREMKLLLLEDVKKAVEKTEASLGMVSCKKRNRMGFGF